MVIRNLVWRNRSIFMAPSKVYRVSAEQPIPEAIKSDKNPENNNVTESIKEYTPLTSNIL